MQESHVPTRSYLYIWYMLLYIGVFATQMHLFGMFYC